MVGATARATAAASGMAGMGGGGISFASIFGGGEIGDAWRFDAEHTDVSGSTVTSVTGLANGLVLDPNGTAPQLGAIGGYDCITFASAHLVYDFASNVAQPGVVMVSVNALSGVSQALFASDDTNARWQMNIDSDGDITAYTDALGGVSVGSNRRSPTEKAVITLIVDGANSKIRFNGVEVASGNLGTMLTSMFSIAGWGAGGTWFSGSMFGALFVDRKLTDDELDYAEKRLAAWGGNALPNGKWLSMFDGGYLSANSGGWNGYTWRQRIPAVAEQLRVQ